MRELLAELTGLLEQGRECVYCSVVETRGSTPQKAGAAMLVFPDGTQRGTLGGGCVEAEVKQRALRLLGDSAGACSGANASLLTFCLDDNYGWDDGLICGGRMTILADPLSSAPGADQRTSRLASATYYARFRRLLEEGQGCTEAVVMNPEPAGAPVGSRYLFDCEGRLVAVSRPSTDARSVEMPEVVWRGLVPVQRRPRPCVSHGIAYLPCWPRITLLVVGGGHVGQAVARLGAEVDFDIWALDDREHYANRERFPAARRLLVGDIGAQLKELAQQITPSVFAIIVTRGHAHDEEALFHLANTQAGYVGMIGSKRKIKMIFEDLRARGISAEALERVHAPLGLAIGSQTVPEISISIVAELISCRNIPLASLKIG